MAPRARQIMAVIQTAGQLTELESKPRWAGNTSRLLPSLGLYNLLTQSYGEIVKTQPNVRTVISFISRNIAQLGIGLYRFVDEDNRERLRGHPFLNTLAKPNPLDRRSTRYRFIHNIVWDVCTYDVAFAYLIEAGERQALIKLKPERLELEGALWPEVYRYKGPRGTKDLDPARVIHFQGSSNVDEPKWGLPPIESLRRILAEEAAAGEYREQFWRSGARLSGWIERPTSAPDWSTNARDRFKQDWDGLYTGEGPAAGGTPILEDDMKFHTEQGADAQSAQYIEARKLSREESAAAYHIDPLWVGIHGTGESFASVVERHKALYQDDLGPWIEMLDDDLTTQALPMFDDDPSLYVKLNIGAKLRGSIEDQAESLNRLTGRPILTVNESRALIDRNPIEGGDGLTVPLNVVVGGQTIPGEAVPGTEAEHDTATASRALKTARWHTKDGLTQAQHNALTIEHREAHRRALERTFDRQKAAILSVLGARATADIADIFDRGRWDGELAADLFGLAIDTAEAFGFVVAEALGAAEPDLELMVNYLDTNARFAAENINATTEDELAVALLEEDRSEAVKTLFAGTVAGRAHQIAQTRVTNVAAFASKDTARQAGRTNKVWIVTSSNSRHPSLDGESVPIESPFSNGLAWPGDSTGSPDETAGCTCFLGFE